MSSISTRGQFIKARRGVPRSPSANKRKRETPEACVILAAPILRTHPHQLERLFALTAVQVYCLIHCTMAQRSVAGETISCHIRAEQLLQNGDGEPAAGDPLMRYRICLSQQYAVDGLDIQSRKHGTRTRAHTHTTSTHRGGKERRRREFRPADTTNGGTKGRSI